MTLASLIGEGEDGLSDLINMRRLVQIAQRAEKEKDVGDDDES